MSRQNAVPLATIHTIHIEIESLGNFQLRQVESLDDTDGSSNTVVVGGSGVLGTVRQDGGHTVTLVVRRVITVPSEVPWYTLANSQEPFTLAQQDEGGERLVYEGCRVSKIDRTGPNDGNLTITVEITVENVPDPIQPSA